MKIESLELINVKSFNEQIIKFSPTVNVLIGANNSGKSTIIKSLLNLQYQTFQKSDIRSLKNYARIYTKISDVNEAENDLFPAGNDLKKFGKGYGYNIFWSITENPPTEKFLFANSEYKVKHLPDHKIKITSSGINFDLKDFVRFPDREDKNNFIFPFLAKRKSSYYDTTHMTKEESFKVSDHMRNLAGKIHILSNASHRKNKEFVRLCDEILQFKIGVVPLDVNSGMEPGIYTSDKHSIPIRAMGDGVANIVGFIVTLLTEDNKLFLIEELENDIHPEALKKLLTLIIAKSDRNQFIVSTHSHIVLKYLGIAPKSKIFFVECNSIDTDISSVPTSSINEVENKPEARIEILERLGYDFNDFELHDSYLLLEESSAERIIKDFLIPNIVPELYNKIKTIAAKGVNDLETRVSDFNRLFVFIHTNQIYYKKAWVIADGDEVGRQCIESIKNEFKTWPKEHFLNFMNENFEDYYPARFKKKVAVALKLKGQQKRDAKKALVIEVMDWALKNREQAIKEFNISAKEVIVVLKKIASELRKKP